MKLLVRTMSLPVAVLAVALLALGCSSSKNTNADSAGLANTSNTAANPAASASLTPAAPSTVLRTPTQLPSSQAGAAAGAPALSDKALSQALVGALLKPTDFPSGYTASAAPETTPGLPGQTAAVQAVYAQVALPNIGFIADQLLGFKDVATAQATFRDLQNAIQNEEASLGIKLTPASSSTKIGDETQVYTVTLAQQGLTFSGYLVGWRRGRLGGTIIFAGSGTDAPQTSDAAVALAQKQDATLAAVGQ